MFTKNPNYLCNNLKILTKHNNILIEISQQDIEIRLWFLQSAHDKNNLNTKISA